MLQPITLNGFNTLLCLWVYWEGRKTAINEAKEQANQARVKPQASELWSEPSEGESASWKTTRKSCKSRIEPFGDLNCSACAKLTGSLACSLLNFSALPLRGERSEDVLSSLLGQGVNWELQGTLVHNEIPEPWITPVRQLLARLRRPPPSLWH